MIDGNGRPTGNPDANTRNRDFLGTTPRDFQTNYLPPPQAGNPEAGQTCHGHRQQRHSRPSTSSAAA